MDEPIFAARMHDLCAALDQRKHAQAVVLARTLKRDLLAASEVDPIQLGWARFYEMKGLFGAQDWAAGYELASSMEAAPFALTLKNGAWCYSAGAECAMRLGLADEVARLSHLSLEAREKLGDHAACLLAAQTGCQLLQQIHRDDLNGPFAQHLIRRGREHSDGEALCHGFHHLMANYAASRRAESIPLLVAGADDLRGLVGRLSAHADLYATLAAIEGADFYDGALDAPTRARRESNQRLWRAASEGNADLVVEAARMGADAGWLDPRHEGMPTPLHVAAFHGHEEVVAALIDLGVTIDVPNAQDRTALHLAAVAGNGTVASQLLTAGASTLAVDFCQQTALHLAAVEDFSDVVYCLLSAGAKPDVRDLAGCTPLACAAGGAGTDTVAVLVQLGADADAPSREGQTPLMFAAMEGNTEIVRLLVARGARVDAKDCHGMTALDFARQEKHPDLEGILSVAEQPIDPNL